MKWDKEAGVSLNSHRSYIEEFADTFYEQVKNLIDKNQQYKKEYQIANPNEATLMQEVLEHAHFCNETAQKFHGRNDLLLEVYILNLALNKLLRKNLIKAKLSYCSSRLINLVCFIGFSMYKN